MSTEFPHFQKLAQGLAQSSNPDEKYVGELFLDVMSDDIEKADDSPEATMTVHDTEEEARAEAEKMDAHMIEALRKDTDN